MKQVRLFGAAALIVLLGIAGPIYAQEQQDKGKPPQEQQQRPQTQKPQTEQRPAQQPQQRPAQRPQAQQPRQAQPQAARPQTQQRPQARRQQPQQPQERAGERPGTARPAAPARPAPHAPPARTEQANRAARPSPQGRPAQGQRVQPSTEANFWQSHRASNWQADHRTWAQRGGYNGYRIPAATFNLHFGPNHFFHVWGLPLVMYDGYPSFQYEGLWVSLLDPVPPYWPPNWYQTDNLYLQYTGDGYYLYDQRFPNYAIAVMVYQA